MEQDDFPEPPNNIQKSEKPLISDSNFVSMNPIEKILSQAINMNNDGEMHEPTCVICSSPLRKEAEDLYNKSTNKSDYSAIIALFMSKGNVKVGVDVIENHIRYHMKGIREIQKMEYANKLQRLSNNTTTLQKISLAESVLIDRLMSINSITPTGDVSLAEIEKIKSTESCRIMTNMTNLIKIRASIMGEMKTSGDIMTFPTQEFVAIFGETIREAKNEREKELMRNLLARLKSIGS